MTLDKAIKRAEEVVEEQEKAAKEWHENQVRKCKLIRGTEMDYTHENECKKCAEEHRQLAEWLKELKQLREQTRWIPVSDRLPEDRELALFSTKADRVFEGRYFDDDTDRQWYSFCDKTFAWNNVVTAWMPLPQPMKVGEENC